MESEDYSIAEAIYYGLKELGNADASTPMGAIEAHGVALKESAETISYALRAIAESIDGLVKETARFRQQLKCNE